MNRLLVLAALTLFSLGIVATVPAAEADVVIPAPAPVFGYPAHNLAAALLNVALFGLLGIVLAIVGFKMFDWLTPGNLQHEVFDKCNIAAAILGAAVIIGICMIIAASVHG